MDYINYSDANNLEKVTNIIKYLLKDEIDEELIKISVHSHDWIQNKLLEEIVQETIKHGSKN